MRGIQIPGHHAPPAIFASAFVYAIAATTYLSSTRSTSDHAKLSNQPTNKGPAKTVASRRASDAPEKLLSGSAAGERISRNAWILLSGLPNSSALFWTFATAAINALLLLSTIDVVYRAPYAYPSNELSFARFGYVSDTTARILIREPDQAQLPLFVSYREAGAPQGRAIDDTWKSAGKVYLLSTETDFTYALTISRLRSSTSYQYAVSNNHTGFFTTAPSVGVVVPENDKLTFLTSSCIKPRFPYNPLHHPLTIPGFKQLAKWIPSLQASFMLFLGDFIYIDVPRRLGYDVETYRREYRQVYSSPDWPSVSTDLPWIHVLDDHEIANDWDGNTTEPYPAAVDPWHIYHTSINPPPADPGTSYFTFTRGPATFFLMDTRRYRSPSSALTPDHPNKTMLGAQQLSSLLKFLSDSPPEGVKWKFVISSIPFTRNWRFGSSDTWGGYLHERQIILENMWNIALSSSGTGVVVLSGDRHEFAATAFPPPKDGKWPLSATVHEFSTSPLSMFYLPVRTYWEKEGEDEICIKYLPDGNSKFGAIEVEKGSGGEQALVRFRLFIDGEEVWSYVITTPPAVGGGGRGKDAIWG